METKLIMALAQLRTLKSQIITGDKDLALVNVNMLIARTESLITELEED